MRDTWGKFLTIVRFIPHSKVRKMVALVPLVLSFDSLPFLINLYLKVAERNIHLKRTYCIKRTSVHILY